MREPKRIWWARPRKLCALERPGGGGRSHRPDRRREEIEWLKEHRVRTVVSLMPTRHNLDAYEEAGLRWLHFPVQGQPDEEQLNDIIVTLGRVLRRAGAVAVHGNRHTDLAAAICAMALDEVWAVPVEIGLIRAERAGLTLSERAADLVSAGL